MKTTVKIDKDVEIKTPFYGKDLYKNLCITENVTIEVYPRSIITSPNTFEHILQDVVSGRITECTKEEFIDAYMAAQGSINESFKTLSDGAEI